MELNERQRESDIQADIIKALNRLGCHVWRTNAGSFSKGNRHIAGLPAGYPDISGHRDSDGKAIYIEVKNKTGKLRKVQEQFALRIKDDDVLYGVARSVEDAIKIVRR
ncbi:VRR-NUC domain-containing protein [Agrilactobacillus fermenti]|uniref:VRR-NUC domain-containing protein n=1 Tax=Agrilactobacillus fermenti TaxID=2586909 RepID=UPI001E4712F8|nr:VRR-NUC domain-containing protein [Agrilactobacillus fermenti]